MKNINYNKIKDNIDNLARKHKLMIVLKDDAYNFGLKNVCVISLLCGIKHFAVKDVNEALEVRRLSSETEVLVLGKMPEDIASIKRNNITVTVTSEGELDTCLKHNINYHVEINTSMNRFGICYKNLPKYISDNMQGVYIHTPIACELENKKILEFLEENISNNKLENKMIHVGGSSFLKIKHSYFNRVGIEIFKNSLSFTAKILQVKRLLMGEYIGYDHSYRLTKDSYIAICNVGYVNGLSRQNKYNYCYINNKKYFFEGYKCMDYSYIVVDETIKQGDTVQLLGINISEDTFCDMNDIIKHQMYLNIK